MSKHKHPKQCPRSISPASLTYDSRFSPDVLRQIQETIGSRREESGGILGTTDGGKTIDHFYFDKNASVSSMTYSPNTAALNDVIEAWNKQDVMFCGFIHSHPRGCKTPSFDDYLYAERILSCMELPNDTMIMPIVQVYCPKKRLFSINYYEHRLARTLVTESESAGKSSPAKNFSPKTENPAAPDCNINQEPKTTEHQSELNGKDDNNEAHI